MEEKIKLSKMQKTLLEYILVEYAVNGKFIETNGSSAKDLTALLLQCNTI